ncbi:MAG TPA: ABC transporter permease [Acidobacteriaceae bacterium]|nr:ABC transporter permease [Acidobacteriaceae bacterium]
MHWFRQFFTRSRIYSDISEEIQQHLEEKIDALMAEGMSRKEAEHAARREFGNVTQMEERGREAWMWPRTESLLADAKFALRKLRNSPGFTITAIITLALGIGANVVVFSVLNGLVLRPLDVPHPQNLFQIVHGSRGWYSQSYRDYIDYRDRDASFSGMLACQNLRVGLNIGKSAVRSWGYAVSGNYFDVLGMSPALGRFFHAADVHGPASAPYIVLSYDLWRRQFNFNPNILGETVELNKHPFTVLGVAPKNFYGTDLFYWPDYWIPLVNAAQVTGNDDLSFRDHYSFYVFGRLKPGVTPQQATQSLNALATQMAKQDPKDEALSARLIPSGPGGDSDNPTRKALLDIMLLAFLVLLAACANLATLFAARAADRSGELAIRIAIGSSRWHVLRQLLAEALLISTAGGLVGTAFASLLLRALSHWQPYGDFPTHFLIAPDIRVYLGALALSIASGLLFGLLPARQIWRTDVVQAIKSGHLHSESFRRFALRDLLLLVQIAVCTLLVTASLVAVRGMILALHVPLAFQPAGIVLGQAELRMAGYTGEQALPIQKRMLQAAEAIPGVTAAALADGVPFQGGSDWFVYRQGTTEFLPAHAAFDTQTFLISPGYLKTAQTRLLAGRDFTWHDDGKSPGVAIINQTFAHRLFGKGPAIGQHFVMWATARYEVVGVVEDGKYNSITEDARPAMFLPLAQGWGGYLSSGITVLVRSHLPSDQLTAALLHALHSVEPSVPFTIRSWTDAVDLSMVPTRAATAVLCVMGLLAAMLAVTGIFGMAAYSVSKRTREQAIRMALGAQRMQVMRSTLRRPLLLLLAGSGIGFGAGLLASHLMAHLISFATPHDPLVLLGVLFTMMLLGILATLVPARRALAIDPARLLRES